MLDKIQLPSGEKILETLTDAQAQMVKTMILSGVGLIALTVILAILDPDALIEVATDNSE